MRWRLPAGGVAPRGLRRNWLGSWVGLGLYNFRVPNLQRNLTRLSHESLKLRFNLFIRHTHPRRWTPSGTPCGFHFACGGEEPKPRKTNFLVPPLPRPPVGGLVRLAGGAAGLPTSRQPVHLKPYETNKVSSPPGLSSTIPSLDALY